MGKPPANKDVRFWRDVDLPDIELRYSSYHEEIFRKHSHEAYSIGLILTGRTVFWLEHGEHEALPGQIALIGPGALHACNPDSSSTMSYLMYYVQEDLLVGLAREIFDEPDSSPTFPRPVIDDPELYAGLKRLALAIQEQEDTLVKQSLFVRCMGDLLSAHCSTCHMHQKTDPPEMIARVRDHLQHHLDRKITLDELSGVAGVSRYHLIRRFQAEMGLPPHAYQNQLRVVRAKELLVSGHELSWVAHELGFTDQSHFTRVFRQFTGATPSQYQSGPS